MENLEQLNSIGSGVYFPILLTEPTDEEGNKLLTEDGKVKRGWYPVKGDPLLVEENLTALILFMIGQRFREEEFGTRIHECIEEPNTQALNFLVRDFIKTAIVRYESRIQYLAVNTEINGSKINIQVRFSIRNTPMVTESNFEIDSNK